MIGRPVSDSAAEGHIWTVGEVVRSVSKVVAALWLIAIVMFAVSQARCVRRAATCVWRRFYCLRRLVPWFVALVIMTVVIAVALGLLYISTLAGPFDATKTGTVGEWVSGGATAIAVMVAVGAVLLEVGSRRADEELAEAVRAYPWAQLETSITADAMEFGGAAESGGPHHEYLVRVKNDSATPIYDPTIRYRRRAGEPWSEELKFDLGSGCVVPGDAATPAVVGQYNSPWRARVPAECSRKIELELTYRSGTGRFWRIVSDGTIQSSSSSALDWTAPPRIVLWGGSRSRFSPAGVAVRPELPSGDL